VTRHMPLDLDVVGHEVRKARSQVRGQPYRIDQRFELRRLLHVAQARPPVAGFVVPPASIALTRFLAITMRCTSEGPS
jgi:hypothetical protein